LGGIGAGALDERPRVHGLLRIEYAEHRGADAASCSGCARDLGNTYFDAPSGLVWFFNEADRAKFSIPASGSLGNTPRNFFRTSPYFDIDIALLKRIRIKEHSNLEIRADATNVTNSVSFDNPTAVLTSTIFGRIRNSVTSASRKIQLGAKIDF